MSRSGKQGGADEHEDHALVERVIAGDERAFRELIERFEGLIRHITFRMLSDSRDREEIMQDVLLRVYRSLPRFAFASRLSTWIGRITYRQCLTYMGRSAISQLEDVQGDSPFPDSPYSQTPDRLQEIVLDEAREVVRASIGKLPINQRLTITLYHLDGIGIEEIGEILEMPAGTVKSHLYRARLKLRNELSEKYRRGDL